jgi:hypothetical protein
MTGIFGSYLEGKQLAAQRETEEMKQKTLLEQQMGIQDQRRKQAMVEDAKRAELLIRNGDTQGAMNLLSDRAQQSSQSGGNPRETMQVYNALRAGQPDQALQMITNFRQLFDEGYKPPPVESDEDFLKETRQEVRKGLTTFNKRADEVNSSYKKINSLLSKDDLGRADIASVITLTARLLSPGIVTNTDFSNLTEGVDPIAFAIQALRKGGMDEAQLNALNSYYDPTNPSLFKKDEFLDMTNRIVSAEVPSLLNQYDDINSMAQRAKISPRAYETYFGGPQKTLNSLRSLVQQPKQPASKGKFKSQALGREVSMSEIEQTASARGISVDEVMKQLGIQQ